MNGSPNVRTARKSDDDDDDDYDYDDDDDVDDGGGGGGGGDVICNSMSLIYKCWRIIFYTPVQETILSNWRTKFSMAGI